MGTYLSYLGCLSRYIGRQKLTKGKWDTLNTSLTLSYAVMHFCYRYYFKFILDIPIKPSKHADCIATKVQKLNLYLTYVMS